MADLLKVPVDNSEISVKERAATEFDYFYNCVENFYLGYTITASKVARHLGVVRKTTANYMESRSAFGNLKLDDYLKYVDIMLEYLIEEETPKMFPIIQRKKFDASVINKHRLAMMMYTFFDITVKGDELSNILTNNLWFFGDYTLDESEMEIILEFKNPNLFYIDTLVDNPAPLKFTFFAAGDGEYGLTRIEFKK